MKKLLPVILLLLSATVYSQNADIRILSEINLNRNRDLDKTFRAVSNTAGPHSIWNTGCYVCGKFNKQRFPDAKKLPVYRSFRFIIGNN